jgi:hypothetical protein
VPALVLVAVSVWVIFDPDEADAPDTFVCVTVQAKVVPPTLLVNAIDVALPEQIDCEEGVAVADGVGLTVTVMVCTGPRQPPVEVGVTVYTTVCTLVELFVIVLLSVAVVCVVMLSPVVFGLSLAIQL